MATKPFCERPVGLHLVGLGLLSVAVMVAAAAMPARARSAVRRTPATTPRSPAPPPADRAPAPALDAPAQQLVAQPIARSALSNAAATPDVVSSATPGAIHFVAQNAVPFRTAAQRIRPSVVSVVARTDRGVQRQGSGVVVSAGGLVVTSDHVIDGAATVAAKPSASESPFAATVVSVDPANDLALLRLAGEGPFVPATLADSSLVQVGDWVLAVGHPFGLGLTVTAGIVGSVRGVLEIPGGPRHQGLLQTDAPINEGSSGGPLVNLRGEVVGINTAIFAPTGVFSGAGFAVPSSRVSGLIALAQPTTSAALAPPAPSAVGPWLGVGLAVMTPDLAAELSYPYSGGLYVASVVMGSPADQAELLRGDVITSVAGRPVASLQDMAQLLAPLSSGTRLEIVAWRGGRTERLSIVTGGETAARAR